MLIQIKSAILRQRFATAVVAAAFLCAASHGQAQPADNGGAHTVVIRQMQFNPSQITVKPGDTIEWKNEDIFAHSVTANDGSFDSGLIAPGGSWKTTLNDGKTIGYHCRPHPNMTATIMVAAVDQASPSAASPSMGLSLPNSPHELHPILVNFTAALLPLALLSDVMGRMIRRESLHHAAAWMMLYEAAITPFTVAAGWWWKSASAGALPARLIVVHQWLGTAAALIFVILAVWRWRTYKSTGVPSSAYLLCSSVAMLALVFQGMIGGRMAFGQ